MLHDVSLKEICAVDWGNTNLTKKKYVEDGEYLAVSATGADGRIGHFEHEADVCVLSAIGAQCGKMFFPQQRFTAIKNTITLTPKKERVGGKYLYYLFTAIELPKRGAAQPFISKGDIEIFQVPHVPPLAEQQRIVAKLDAAFAEIDMAISAAEQKEAHITSLKRSLLSEKLSTENANGEVRNLGDLCDLQNGFAFKSSDYVESSNTLNIRMSNIRPNGTFNEEHNIRYLPDDYAEAYKGYKLSDGDLIIAMTDMAGDPKILGLPTIVSNLKGRTFLLNQRVGKLHDFAENLHVPYLCYFLSTLKEFYKEKGAGGLQINISKKDILSATIFLPSLSEQVRVVERLDSLFGQLDDVGVLLRKKTENLSQLKSSLLASELTQQSEAA